MKKIINALFNNTLTGNKAFKWSIYYPLILGIADVFSIMVLKVVI